MDALDLYSIVKREIAIFGNDAANAPMPVVFQCFNIIESAKEEDYPLHIHEFCEVISPLKGEYKCQLNGKTLRLEPGEMLFIQYEDAHEDFFQAGASYATLRFELMDNRLRRPFSKNADSAHRIMNMTAKPSLATIFNELKAESGNDAMVIGVVEGLCQAFFWKLIKSYPPKELSQEFSKVLSQRSAKGTFLALFRASGRHFDVEAAARQLGVSRRKLYGMCEDAFGIPPAKAFLKFKMNEAADLLIEKDMKIQDLALRFGFDDQFHFSRAFKRCFKMSPSTFKEMHKMASPLHGNPFPATEAKHIIDPKRKGR